MGMRHLGGGLVHHHQGRTHPLMIERAGLRWGEPTSRALEEPNAEMGLQRTDAPRHHRRIPAKCPARRREAAFAESGQEG